VSPKQPGEFAGGDIGEYANFELALIATSQRLLIDSSVACWGGQKCFVFLFLAAKSILDCRCRYHHDRGKIAALSRARQRTMAREVAAEVEWENNSSDLKM
jgi:hypothetical protein